MSSKDHPVAVELVTDDLRGLAARQGKTAYGGYLQRLVDEADVRKVG
jgi:hypothetical protein